MRGLAVEDDLVHRRQHLRHGLDIHAPARHIGRLAVFLVDGAELLRLAAGLRDRLLAIGFRLLHDLHGAAARFGDDGIGIGLGIFPLDCLVALRRLQSVKGLAHLRRVRRIDQLDAGDGDAEAVGVEGLLHDPPHARFDGGAARIDVVVFDGTDGFAHGALGDRPDGFFGLLVRVFHVEDEGAGVLHDPAHGKMDVGDVVIRGQHEAFRRHVAGLRQIADLGGLPVTDIERILVADFDHFRGLDRPGQMVVDAGRAVGHDPAEAHHEALLVAGDEIDAAEHPSGNKSGRHGPQGLRRHPSGGQKPLEPFASAPQQLVQIGWAAGAMRLPAPGTALSVPVSAAGLAVPRHAKVRSL